MSEKRKIGPLEKRRAVAVDPLYSARLRRLCHHVGSVERTRAMLKIGNTTIDNILGKGVAHRETLEKAYDAIERLEREIAAGKDVAP